MAHDRMMNDDVDRKMNRSEQDDFGKQDFGKQTPGRNPQQDQQGGQKGADQKNKPGHTEDENDFGVGGGGAGKTGQKR